MLVDVDKQHNKAVDIKYVYPARFGLPAIVILDSGGKVLTTQNTGELEKGDRYSPEKVIAFLKKWSPGK